MYHTPGEEPVAHFTTTDGVRIYYESHGTGDPLIPLARASRAQQILTGLGYRVEWHEYPMPHSVCDAEIRDIGAWLGRILA